MTVARALALAVLAVAVAIVSFGPRASDRTAAPARLATAAAPTSDVSVALPATFNPTAETLRVQPAPTTTVAPPPTTEPPTTTSPPPTEAPTTSEAPPMPTTTTEAPPVAATAPPDTEAPQPPTTEPAADYSPPGGGWEQLRQCESGGNYATHTGNGYSGAYQFDQRTWNGVVARMGRADLVGVAPADASPPEQDQAAQQLYAERGAQPWPVCGRYL